MYDRVLEFDASEFVPFVTWGTNPGMVAPVTGAVPDPAAMTSAAPELAALAARRCVHGIASLSQREAQLLCQQDFIFDDENAHAWGPLQKPEACFLNCS